MAQAKLSDYFTSKKRTDAVHAAKRRKIEIPFSNTECKRSSRTRSKSDDGKKSPATNPLIPSDSESDLERDGVPPLELSFTLAKVTTRGSIIHSKDTVSATKSYSNKKGQRFTATSRSRGKTTTSSTVKPDSSGQSKLTDFDLLIKSSLNLHSNTYSGLDSESLRSGGNNDRKPKDELTTEQQTEISEEVTSFWDNHGVGDQNTPRKRVISTEEIALEAPHTRRRKVLIRKTSPSKLQDPVTVSGSAKKKLVLIPPLEPGTSKTEDDLVDDADKEVSEVMTGKSHLLALVAEIVAPIDHAISPLPATPERQEVSSSPESIVPATPNLQNLTQKLKPLTKTYGQALKNRLKQNGKLVEKSEELNKAIRENKKQNVQAEIVTEDTEAEKSEKFLPAALKFGILTEEQPPTLTLPLSYRILETTFRDMDAIVSMMHNQSKMCTFSKLKTAVEHMTRSNFDEKTLGQIKTIMPDAYIFRQEKNIPTSGVKVSGYELTVEANLKKGNTNIGGPLTTEGKPTFTPSARAKRQQCFRNNLINYLKHLHKNFLASLNPPVTVNDDKLTHWHKKFIGSVSEVVPASLPQPPQVKRYHSAQDVFESFRRKSNPQTEETLSKTLTVTDAENSKNQNNSQGSSLSSLPTAPSSSFSLSGHTTASLNGIPPALLARPPQIEQKLITKVMAKQAKKLAETLTRSPAKDNETRVMNNLPEIIKILHAYFVTERKTTVQLDVVYQKLMDSYHTYISMPDVVQHVDMLKQLAPDLVSVVVTSNGKFLKLNKDVDVHAVSNDILNRIKSRK